MMLVIDDDWYLVQLMNGLVLVDEVVFELVLDQVGQFVQCIVEMVEIV